MDIQTALNEYGLDEKETKVYLYLLEHGTSSAHDISKFTSVLRQTAYDTLSKLAKKGLISETVINKKTNYAASEPEALLYTLKEKEKLISGFMKDMKDLQNKNSMETITRQFTGIKGIKTLYEDFLKAKTPIKTIQPDIPEKLLKEYFVENFSIKRIEKNIPMLILKEKISTEFQKSINTNKKKLREVRLSNELKDVETHIVIYDNKVVFLDYRNTPIATLIENEHFKSTQEILFNNIWNKSRIF